MKEKVKIKWLLVSAIVLLASLTGITYAWFRQDAAMTTLLSIEKPDTITITDADGSEMTELNLDYREGNDKRDSDGTIHIFRPVCIKSTNENHQLEIVHTTNLSSLEFRIYPVEPNTVFDSDHPGIPLNGSYANSKDGAEKMAKEETLQNYSGTDVINAYAYPLYWLAQVCSNNNIEGYRQVFSEERTEFDVLTKSYKTFYYTYYYLEISWKETTKETDLFYVMARNVSE